MSKNLEQADLKRRFSGVGRLYTPAGQKNINESHFIVVGLGGVGSWVAESLARTEVGHITLIDLDNVAESNTNRQIQALDGNYGKPKVQALAE
ncbi:tRNA threonylcarbamoyladenosine dehydratase, partial [Turicimonas muris]